jgi:hypothetical protein
MRVTPQIICDIIKAGMSLKDDQIWIYNQRRAIPEDKRLYVTVGVMSMKPYANNRTFNATTYNDELSQYFQETLSINLMSYTTECLERYAEVLGSLISTYSQQAQEEFALKIAETPTGINDVSAIEGTTLLNRIVITLPVLRKYSMLIAANYYDTFEDVDMDTTEK